ncbi:uncharacterized protein LOC116410794 [Xenopus tropicalis]|nr:uncharacterized protein LOC116410794 [Xenopus tropicalis]
MFNNFGDITDSQLAAVMDVVLPPLPYSQTEDILGLTARDLNILDCATLKEPDIEIIAHNVESRATHKKPSQTEKRGKTFRKKIKANNASEKENIPPVERVLMPSAPRKVTQAEIHNRTTKTSKRSKTGQISDTKERRATKNITNPVVPGLHKTEVVKSKPLLKNDFNGSIRTLPLSPVSNLDESTSQAVKGGESACIIPSNVIRYVPKQSVIQSTPLAGRGVSNVKRQLTYENTPPAKQKRVAETQTENSLDVALPAEGLYTHILHFTGLRTWSKKVQSALSHMGSLNHRWLNMVNFLGHLNRQAMALGSTAPEESKGAEIIAVSEKYTKLSKVLKAFEKEIGETA